jgi:hypothetical protein
MQFKHFINMDVIIANSVEEVINLIELNYEEFKKEVEVYQTKGNKSANRRARGISSDLDKYFKQFRALSIEADKETKGE